jgi:hypothetical protein
LQPLLLSTALADTYQKIKKRVTIKTGTRKNVDELPLSNAAMQHVIPF